GPPARVRLAGSWSLLETHGYADGPLVSGQAAAKGGVDQAGRRTGGPRRTKERASVARWRGADCIGAVRGNGAGAGLARAASRSTGISTVAASATSVQMARSPTASQSPTTTAATRWSSTIGAWAGEARSVKRWTTSAGMAKLAS